MLYGNVLWGDHGSCRVCTVAESVCAPVVKATAKKEIGCGSALCEDDIPGASLSGRSASTLTVSALKRWLLYRAAPTKGKKAELVER